MNERLSLQIPGAVQTAERDVDLHAVRPADRAAGRSAEAAAVSEPWAVAWRRSVRVQRALRERQYCQQIRDARAAGRPPLTADEFFAATPRETILEL